MRRRSGTGTIETTRDGRFRARYPLDGERADVGIFPTPEPHACARGWCLVASPRKVRPVTPATEKHRLAAAKKLCELQTAALALGALAVARLDVRTPNPLNGIGAGSRIAMSYARKKQRALAALVVGGALRGRVVLPCVVLVRRVAPSSGLDAHDSLPASLKSIVDGIADALGLASDRDARVRWTYAQRRGVPGEHAVEVEVWPMAADSG